MFLFCCCVALRHRRGRQDLVRNGEIVEVLAANASQNIVSEALSEQIVDHITMSGLDAPPLTQEDFESLAYFCWQREKKVA